MSNESVIASESEPKQEPERKRAALVIIVDVTVDDYDIAERMAKRLAQVVRFSALDAVGSVTTGGAYATVARCDAETFIGTMAALGAAAAQEAPGEETGPEDPSTDHRALPGRPEGEGAR